MGGVYLYILKSVERSNYVKTKLNQMTWMVILFLCLHS
jgi:hypothetical protein